jgi:flagellar L-ring protein precursor FlgH
MKNNRIIFVFILSVMMSACATTRAPFDPKFSAVMPEVDVAPQPSNGAIYQTGYGVALFEDQRARRVGDILTVKLIEKTDASKQASTSATKDQDIDTEISVLLGGSLTRNGRGILDNSVTNERDFEGEGESSQSNRLSGSITVTVSQVLANGNLVVRGEKLLTLNQGDEFVQFSGIVRSADIQPDNTVLSTKVANTQIAYSGRGAVADSNKMGWLSRFFNSVLWPF